VEVLLVLTGLVVGGIGIWFIQGYRCSSNTGLSPEQAEELNARIKDLELGDAQKDEQIRHLENDLKVSQKKLSGKQAREIELSNKLTRAETERISSEKRVKEQREEFETVKKQLKIDFQNLANSILEDKSKKFTEYNKDNMDTLLKPLNEKINEFRERLEKNHETQSRDQVQLREQIKNLTTLNVRMSEEANNLTQALKGKNKTMGNWGELVLETLLEHSGLTRDEEYVVQESFKTDDGKRSQPDVVINLPDKKHLVIDSKVSLVDYERWCSSENDEDKKPHLKNHVASIKRHINDLSQKNYQDLYHVSSPDFILMFVPLDPALIVALQNEPNLFMEAFDRGVFLVCPATLLFALRTIANLWRREKQNSNAMEIAKRGGDLYDKFVGFYNQLTKLGDCLKKTQDCYEDSISKLKTGKGSLVRRVEIIKELGARTNKSLPDSANDDSSALFIETANSGTQQALKV
jgi:DNA recombination protein RmuC